MALAYFSTWTTYGTWLPGDDRGWFERGLGQRDPDLSRAFLARLVMTETAIVLASEQQRLVEATIRKHCEIRGWELHALNCRTNHAHVIVTADDHPIEVPREQFKSWTTRRLKEHPLNGQDDGRLHWWTERGWDLYLDTPIALANAVVYVEEGQ